MTSRARNSYWTWTSACRFLLMAAPVSAGHIAAFWMSEVGPGLLMQDDGTGDIRYSMCNSYENPVFATDDDTFTLELSEYPPKNGTSLAGSGWLDQGANQIHASVFYLDQANQIINPYMTCDTGTGKWVIESKTVISNNSPRPADDTGLAVCLLGEKEGYRVFYNDNTGKVQQLGWKSSTNWWGWVGLVTDDAVSANALAVTFPGADDLNMTVVVPRDKENMGFARFHWDDLWYLESFPRSLNLPATKTTNATASSKLTLNTNMDLNATLPAWDGKPSSLALTEDESYTRSVFYLGTDSQLYQIGNINYAWRVLAQPGEEYWPKADKGSDLAAASDFSSSVQRIYYMSNGSLIEANGDNGSWSTASALATTAPSPTSSSSPSGSPDPSSSNGGGLSTGAKAGVGVGVSVGALALIGMGAALCFARRKQKKKDEAAEAAALQEQQYQQQQDYMGFGGSPSTAGAYPPNVVWPPPGSVPGYMAEGANLQHPQQQQWAATDVKEKELPPEPQEPQELSSPEIYEMPTEQKPTEMIGEGHYREAP